MNLTAPDWTARGLCIDLDPEDWFHGEGLPVNHPAWDAPRAVCQACPVRDACLQYALDNEEAHGMWGALTPAERHKLRPRKHTQRQPIMHGTAAGEKQHRRHGERPCTACQRAANIARRVRVAS